LPVLAIVLDAGALFVLVPLAAAAAWLSIVVVRAGGNRTPTRAGERGQIVDLRGRSRVSASNIRPPRGLSPVSQLLIVWVLAALLVLITSELFVAPDDVGRQQTVLHLGMQSWVLLACASAPALLWVWSASCRKGRSHPYIAIWAVYGWRGAALLLVAAALVYPLSATPARVADRFDARGGPTLDGMAFMRTGLWAENGRQFPLAEDAEAIEWMRANISGTPIVLEAQTDPYRWAGRVSTYTGLPTLLGWSWHEHQQRSVAMAGPVIDSRQRLIKRLYTVASPSEIVRDLQLYGVEYVYVGQLERALYPQAGLARFDALAQAGKLQVVYQRGATVIYQVARAAHPPAVLTTTLPVEVPSMVDR
jgi:uncharacterized membrane protein